MEWFRITNKGIEFIEEEVRLVPEVQAILSPKYNKKERAELEIKYLCLAYSPKSPYKDYSEKDRLAEARLDCGFSEDWEESPELKALIPKFKRAADSKAAKLLITVERFIDKFDAHLNSIDLNERTQNGTLIHSPKLIMETLERLPRFAETLQQLEVQVRSGVITKTSTRGDHELGWMATQEQSNYESEHTDKE